MHGHKGMISIWFFIGILLLFYGILIMERAFGNSANPPEHPVVLAELARRRSGGERFLSFWAHGTQFISRIRNAGGRSRR